MADDTKVHASDAELLHRYVRTGSPDAFRQIVDRHAGMVEATCRRGLSGDRSRAEDAAQAVFIVLAQKAQTIRQPSGLGGWLYRTAQAVVKNMIKEEARRHKREHAAAEAERFRRSAEPDPAWETARVHLDRALSALRPIDQEAILLHFLEGRSQTETAHILGCSQPAVNARLAGALRRMRTIFRGFGLSLSSAALADGLAHSAAPSAQMALVETCQTAAMNGLTGATATVGPAAIAQGVMNMMFWAKLKTAAVIVAVVSITGTGAGFGVHEVLARENTSRTTAPRPPEPNIAADKGPAPKPPTPPQPKPQPKPALQRQGSTSYDWGNMDDTPDYTYTQAVYTPANAPKAPAVEELPKADTVTQYGITWTFDKPVPVGRFITGDYYVAGPVTVTMIDPKPLHGDEVKDVVTKGMMSETEYVKAKTLARHGSMLNHPATEKSGFDSRMNKSCFEPKLFTPLPIVMNPGDALISTISYDTSLIEAVGSGNFTHDDRMVKVAAVLTCLAEPQPADAFRPSFVDCKNSPIFLARNLHRDQLYSLPLPKEMPNVESMIRSRQRPWVDMSMYGFANPARNMPRYGQDITGSTSTIALVLHLALPPEQKEKLLVNFVQSGIDLWGIARGGYSGWMGHGGYGSGRKWNIIFAGIMLGDDKMQHPKQHVKAVFGEDVQTLWGRTWTGCNVAFISHPLYYDESEEMLHPTEWKFTRNESYRVENTSPSWPGEALAIRLMRAEALWDHDPFLAYVDRWLAEDHLAVTREIYGSTHDAKVGWKEARKVGNFAREMWETYRKHLPEPLPGMKVPPSDAPSAAPTATPLPPGFFTHHNAAGGNGFDAGNAVVLDAQGRIVVCGYSDGPGSNADRGIASMALWRFNPDGSLDKSFNQNGFATSRGAPGNPSLAAAEDLAIDKDGRIVVVGWSYNAAQNRDLVLWRFTADGKPDPAFGGEGLVGHHNAAGANSHDGGKCLLLAPDGKLLVGGYSAASGYAGVVWRFNPDGSLDKSFNQNGFALLKPINAVEDLAFGAGGRIIACGIARLPSGADERATDLGLMRLLPDGVPDSTFGKDGQIFSDLGGKGQMSDLGYSIAVDPKGRILVAGATATKQGVSDLAVWRFLPDGAPDIAFNKKGVAVHGGAAGGKGYEGIGNHDAGKKVLIDPVGRILVAGYSINANKDSDLVLWRYTEHGELDKSFGQGGVIVQDLGYGCDRAEGLALDANDNAVVCGFATTPRRDYDLVLWRCSTGQKPVSTP